VGPGPLSRSGRLHAPGGLHLVNVRSAQELPHPLARDGGGLERTSHRVVAVRALEGTASGLSRMAAEVEGTPRIVDAPAQTRVNSVVTALGSAEVVMPKLAARSARTS
jgi:hypothetical protein